MRLSSKYHPWAIAALLLLITAAAYHGVLRCGFISYDDDKFVSDNPFLKAGLHIDGIKWAFGTFYQANWHPLTWMSYMVDKGLYGLHPMGFHLTNLLFHLANVLVLLVILKRMTGSLWKSAFVAGLFAVHPLHVESVAWIAERKDVLSAFFWFSTMWAYTRYAERPDIKRYLPVVILYALGLMAKPMLVTLPLVLLLLDYWPLGRIQRRWNLVWEKLPLLALAAGSSVVTWMAQKQGEALSGLDRMSLGERLANALVAYATYLYKTVWPVKLAVFYPLAKPPAWEIVGAAALLALISFLVIGMKRPYLTVGWLWFIITLIPVIGIVQVGAQSMADRYTYIPLVGIFVMIAWGISELRKARIAVTVSACVILVVLAIGTWVQAGYWRDSASLFQHAIDVTEGNYLAHLNLGWALAQQGQVDEAIDHYSEAIRMRPSWDRAYYNLGTMLSQKGDTQEAIAAYQEALRLNPNFAEARVNLAGQLVKAGRTQEALELGQQSTGTQTAGFHFNLGCALDQQGKLAGAMEEYREAIRMAPGFGGAHNNLAVDYYYSGVFSEAWKEVHMAQKCGTQVPPAFLQVLAAKMPDPEMK